ncbi:hypothetical protein RhiirA4_466830 [Rhizophagus irregularis]|uniref:Uncharacterized protein n=1 Tax=Rhizophagus irregularis TaxID=588596 RepID=A0A2I1GUP3_9GLOM|nr:hypothetical protein RhiirA4_466830 [Rhizophagus irregularis]
MGYFYCKGHNIWNTYGGNFYPNIGIPTSDFSVDYYEVFQNLVNVLKNNDAFIEL